MPARLPKSSRAESLRYSRAKSAVSKASRQSNRQASTAGQTFPWNSASTGISTRLRTTYAIASAGLHGEEPPFPPACIGPDTLCYDLAYSLKDTPFVLWARANGAREAVQGWGMLVEQAAESFFIWRGVRPDTAPILEHMRR